MKLLFLSILIALVVKNNCLKLASDDQDFEVDDSKFFLKEIKMKNSRTTEKEAKRCAFIKLSNPTQFITRIEISGQRKVNHHMTLTACENLPESYELQNDSNSWDSNEFGICGHGKVRRLYTWALDADGINFENGVGIKVSGQTHLNYLVLQIHYNDKVPIGYVDNKSAYYISLTTQELKYQVGVYTLGDEGFIPPKLEAFHMDSGCPIELEYDIVPIAYRTHAHNIIRVISGYALKNSEWIELGRMSPKQPQQFYPVTYKDLIIQRGDYLAARCTANSLNRNEISYTGNRHEDEMCVFYLMYYTDFKGILQDVYCFKDNSFLWSLDLPLSKRIPKNNDNLKGVHLKRPDFELL